jgi:hypothetical protein
MHKLIATAFCVFLLPTATFARSETADAGTLDLNSRVSSDFLERVQPNLLLAVELRRQAIGAEIVARWKNEISEPNFASLQNKLIGLRSDALAMAHAAQSYDGVLEILIAAEKSTGSARFESIFSRASQAELAADRAKALGETGRDLLYSPVTPCRILDTRSAVAAGIPNPPVGNVAYNFKAFSSAGFAAYGGNASDCGVPTSGEVKGIVLAVSLLQQPGLPNFSAYLSIADTNNLSTLLSTAALNFNGALATSSTVVVQTNANDNLYFAMPAQLRANFVFEVTGYFMAPSRAGNGLRIVQTNDATYPDAPITINGSASNTATGRGATIVGGGYTGIGCTGPGGVTPYHCENRVAGDFAIIGGGFANESTAFASAIFGGQSNVASAQNSAVLAGQFNKATQQNAVIVGGQNGTASGFRSIVVGGDQNVASGDGAVVSGGRGNTAAGTNSWAGGTRARSLNGAFVWSDGIANAEFASTVANEFAVRASGGVRLVTQVDALGAATGLCSLPSGGAPAWACVSDRNAKEAIVPVNPRDILSKVISLPLTSWQYKGVTRRHMSPMAQDFWSAFGLGVDDKSIVSSDVSGVALAAIQGVNAKLNDEVASLRAQNAKMAKELAAIKKKLGL